MKQRTDWRYGVGGRRDGYASWGGTSWCEGVWKRGDVCTSVWRRGEVCMSVWRRGKVMCGVCRRGERCGGGVMWWYGACGR